MQQLPEQGEVGQRGIIVARPVNVQRVPATRALEAQDGGAEIAAQGLREAQPKRSFRTTQASPGSRWPTALPIFLRNQRVVELPVVDAV